MHARRMAARKLRGAAAEGTFHRPHPESAATGTRPPKRIANFSKGLPHNTWSRWSPAPTRRWSGPSTAPSPSTSRRSRLPGSETYNEDFGFTVQTFDRNTVTI